MCTRPPLAASRSIDRAETPAMIPVRPGAQSALWTGRLIMAIVAVALTAVGLTGCSDAQDDSATAVTDGVSAAQGAEADDGGDNAGGTEDDGGVGGDEPVAGGADDDGSVGGDEPVAEPAEDDEGGVGGDEPVAGGAEDDGGVGGDEPVAGGAEDDEGGVGEQSEETAPPGASEAATFRESAPLIANEFELLAPGEYRVDTLGTPYSFVADERLFMLVNSAGFTALAHPDSRRPDDRDIVLMRVSDLSDPTAPNMLRELATEGWSPSDFAGWLDNLDAGVVVTDRQTTTLGGRPALRVDVELGEIECDQGLECVYFADNHLESGKGFNPGSAYRVWMVDQEDEDPIAVIVGVIGDTHTEWFDTAEQVLATLAFGEIEANPVQLSGPGPTDLEILGGAQVTMTEPLVIRSDPRGFDRIGVGFESAGTEYMVNPHDADGDALDTTDDLVRALVDGGLEVTEIDGTTVGGLPARVFDAEGTTRGIRALTFPPASGGWIHDGLLRVWSIEHPDRGLLAITAWGGGPGAGPAFELALQQVEPFVSTLEFTDAG